MVRSPVAKAGGPGFDSQFQFFFSLSAGLLM